MMLCFYVLESVWYSFHALQMRMICSLARKAI